jgi:hypothetical protein
MYSSASPFEESAVRICVRVRKNAVTPLGACSDVSIEIGACNDAGGTPTVPL